MVVQAYILIQTEVGKAASVAREIAEIKGSKVYRVRMGPYASAGTLAAAKQALSSHGIDGTQAIRVNK